MAPNAGYYNPFTRGKNVEIQKTTHRIIRDFAPDNILVVSALPPTTRSPILGYSLIALQPHELFISGPLSLPREYASANQKLHSIFEAHRNASSHYKPEEGFFRAMGKK